MTKWEITAEADGVIIEEIAELEEFGKEILTQTLNGIYNCINNKGYTLLE